MKHYVVTSLLLLVLNLAVWAHAVEINQDNYEFYVGDMDGNGRADLYLHAKPGLLLLDDDIVTPIQIPAVGHSVVSYQHWSSNAYKYSQPVGLALTDTQIAEYGLTRVDSSNIHFGDLNGDGVTDVLVRSDDINNPAVTFKGRAHFSPRLIENFYAEDLYYYYPQRPNLNIEGQVTLTDINQDGRDDMLVETKNRVAYVLFSDASGAVESYSEMDSAALALVLNNIIPGSVAGEFKVNESGQATYKLPIATAPATAGVAPEISLNYNGSGGLGRLGKGWGIGGLSTITRCRYTLDADDKTAPVSFTFLDKFCLDGQRLTLVKDLGGGNFEYRTEIESFAKIIGHVVDATGPRYFTVERKDGSISTYGDGSFSKSYLDNHAIPFAWAISRFQDNAGNYITYSYLPGAGGGHYINRIYYTGNVNTGQVAYNQIKFIYDQHRLDPVTTYMSGYKIHDSLRLTKIESYSDGKLIRSYHLGYRAPETTTHALTSPVTRLTQLVECAEGGCYPAVSFTWSDDQLVAPTLAEGHNTGEVSKDSHNGGNIADINGDGLMDYVWVYDQGESPEYYFHVHLNRGGYFVKDKDVSIRARSESTDTWRFIDYNGDGRQDIVYERDDHWYIRLSRDYGNGVWNLDNFDGNNGGTSFSTGIEAQSSDEASFVDVNADGLADLIYLDADSAKVDSLEREACERVDRNHLYKIKLLERDPSPTHPARPYAFRTEHVVQVNPQHMPAHYDDMAFDVTFPQLSAFDFDGDGRSDTIALAYRQEASWNSEDQDCYGRRRDEYGYVVLTKQQDGDYRFYYDLGYNYLPNLTNRELQVTDINGDGLADLFYKKDGSWKYRLNNGAGFNNAVVVDNIVNEHSLSFADFDGDGDADLLSLSGTDEILHVKSWQPDGFVERDEIVAAGKNDRLKDRPYYADFDGNGSIDIGIMGEAFVTSLQNNKGIPKQVITGITSSLGAKTQITYKSLLWKNGTSEPFYTQQHNAAEAQWPDPDDFTLAKKSPVFDVNAPMYVVQRVATDAPIGKPDHTYDFAATSTVSYRYEGAKMQGGGRGFLGFNKLTTTDEQTQVVTTTTYRQDFPYIGLPSTTASRLNGRLVSRAHHHYEYHPIQPDPTSTVMTYYPYVRHRVNHAYDPVTPDNTAVTSTTATHAYDNYGNLTHSTVATTGDGQSFTQLTQNTYSTDTEARRFGRLLSTEVTYQRPSEPDVVKYSTFEYYASDDFTAQGEWGGYKHMLKREIVEPWDSHVRVINLHYYDQLGNKRLTETLINDIDPETNTVLLTREIRRVSQDYDAKGRYVTKSYNAKGHLVSEVLSRDRFGSPLVVNGLNGTQQTFSYDVMGRQTTVSSNAGASSSTSYTLCLYTTCPAGTAYVIESSANTGARSFEYLDVLGRTTRSKALGFGGIYSVVDTSYDNSSNVFWVSEPYWENESAQHWTTTHYDDLNRVIKVIDPNAEETITGYLGLFTTVVNPLGQSTVRQVNAVGETVRVIDNLGGQVKYFYTADGNLRETHNLRHGTDPAPLVTTMTYDKANRKLTMNDPDKGNWTYRYNGFGELIWQQSANGHTTTMAYDELGRMVSRIDKKLINGSLVETGNAVWEYDTATNGIGLLSGHSDTHAGFYQVFTYDHLGRPSLTTTEVGHDANNNGQFDDGETQVFQESVVYDNLGRVSQQFDASGGGVQNNYNAHGFLDNVQDVEQVNGQIKEYYNIAQTDARGNVTQAAKGGVTELYQYTPERGFLNWINVITPTAFIQSMSFEYNALGHLCNRKNNITNQHEHFGYDGLNRLVADDANPVTCNNYSDAQDYTYDAFGNILSKAGQGSYTYDYANKPHAVRHTSGNNVTYHYDANGNLTSDSRGRNLVYSAFDKPEVIENDRHKTAFSYDTGRGRFLRVDTDKQTNNVTRTYYIGNVEIIEKSDGSSEIKRYLQGDAIVKYSYNSVGVLIERKENYLFKDHIGSVVMVADFGGTNLQDMSYEAFGARRHPVNWNEIDLNTAAGQAELMALLDFDTVTLMPSSTNRGYTGHEMLDQVGLIHMNGRVYDPALGRFIQADPIVQAPEDTQSYNRYAYVRNNPLTLTDPTGYSWWGDHVQSKRFRRVLGSVLQIAAPFTGVFAPLVGAIGGAIAARGYGGDIGEGVLWGAFSAVALPGMARVGGSIGKGLSVLGKYGKLIGSAISVGLTSGIITDIRGGKFGHGFASAGLTTLAAPGIGAIANGNAVTEAVIAAVVGGTISDATGGKFTNGALSAAMAYAIGSADWGSKKSCTNATCPDVAMFGLSDAELADLDAIGAVSVAPIVVVGAAAELALELAGVPVPDYIPTKKNIIKFISKRAAFRAAKRDAGIPTSQTHITHTSNLKSDSLDTRRTATEYDFGGGRKVQLHPKGHQFRDGGSYNNRHFNNHGEGGTKNHYEY